MIEVGLAHSDFLNSISLKRKQKSWGNKKLINKNKLKPSFFEQTPASTSRDASVSVERYSRAFLSLFSQQQKMSTKTEKKEKKIAFTALFRNESNLRLDILRPLELDLAFDKGLQLVTAHKTRKLRAAWGSGGWGSQKLDKCKDDLTHIADGAHG